MPLIPTKLHGVLDYLVGLLLIASPWLFGFAAGGAETLIPVILGVGAIAYSMLTNYELGVWGLFPMSVHLWLDALGGAFLAASPWVFGFADQVWVPHLALGLVELAASVTTNTVPQRGAVAGASEAVRGPVSAPRAGAPGTPSPKPH